MVLTYDESTPLPEGMHQGKIWSIGLLPENSRRLSIAIKLPDGDNSFYYGLLPAKIYIDHPLLVLWRELVPSAKPGKLETDALKGLDVQFRLETVFSGNRPFLNITELHSIKHGGTPENTLDDGNIDF